jgi:hypothetical protein
MEQIINSYIQIGALGTFFVVALFAGLWWLTKGRKRSEEQKERQIQATAQNGKIIENNTAALNLCAEVIKANTQQRADEKRCLEKLDERMTRQGEQLDDIQRNQAICMDRQGRK